MNRPLPTPRTRRPWLAVFAALNAFAALAGAVGLITGLADFGETINNRLPFDSLVLAGLALAIIVGIPLTLVAWSAWTAGPRTDVLALAAGVLLIGWIVGQIAVLRALSFFQPTYLAVGIYLVAASHRVKLHARSRGLLFVAVGIVPAAVGVGLLPHPIKSGLTVTAVMSIVLLVVGFSLIAGGAALALRRVHPLGVLAGGGATLIVLAFAVSVISPAVAATVVPPTRVSSTPADLGMEYESVDLTTTDGLELAAWYSKGSNGAGLVVMHGAGSTRSDVLEQAAVLVDGGYSVVLVDARGHGDSDGTAMDFGWYGDLDIAAATGFLAGRAEIDPDRIGIVGFSMGGEEAIGAAAGDPRIRAVVAEGATARQAADKGWLSDVYGWRGGIQEQIEKIQYGVTDFLTEASPPISLRSAVVNAPERRFLLITAGNVDDEGHAASYIQAGANERVLVWNVDGADHIGGYEAEPQDWQQRVVLFLDRSLR